MNLNKSEAFDFISGILFIAELERILETEIWVLEFNKSVPSAPRRRLFQLY